MKMIRTLVLVISCPALLLTTACDPDPVDPPEPIFEVNFNPIYAQDTLRITNNTIGGDSFYWEFGDGFISEDRSPTHVYRSVGQYTLTLEVTLDGEKASKSLLVEVMPAFTLWERETLDSSVRTAVSVDLADFDDDGDLDLVIPAFQSDDIRLYENNYPTWIKHTVDSGMDGVTFAYCGDFTGDGKIDIIGNEYRSKIFYLYTQTETGWESQEIINPHKNGDHFALADMNGDSKLDIITGGSAVNAGPAVWYENQHPTWTERTIHAQWRNYPGWAIADFDGDGLDDVASTLVWESRVVWFKNINNGQSFQEFTIDTDLTHAFGITSRDYDGDGDIDIIAANGGPYFDGGTLIIYENDHPTWTEHLVDLDRDGSTWPEFVDMNQDGVMDAVLTVYNEDRIVWYEKNGDTWDMEVIGSIVGPRDFHVMDIDGNGLFDVIVNGENEVVLFMQQVRYPNQ